MKKFFAILVIMIIAATVIVSKDVIIEERVVKNTIKKYENFLINLSDNDIFITEFYDKVKKISTNEFQKSILMKSLFNYTGADLLSMSNELYEKTVKDYNENLKEQLGEIKNNSIKISKIYYINDYNSYVYTLRKSIIYTSEEQKNIELFVLRKYELIRSDFNWFISNTVTDSRYFNEGEIDNKEFKQFITIDDNEIKFDEDILDKNTKVN
ncbi:hypothetical protein [Oceanirhabdus sp. W0125-5]|uniref:hypothetical protein n=1 Tax=Oceanirhabdus sp. W0125-5 TaxID=2999116 RepID=UPI0022F32EF6|nr:hypothetical protein [Oceanirhabdus sp. W0125-5]WBW95147.1 hypothetical protein OW730_15800 [Oceanirhabdus sp. W0125-5]